RVMPTPNRQTGAGLRSRAGFTLIELLMVVTLIVLIVALTIPALRRARDTSRLSVCMANLHQVSVASLNYSVNNRQKFPDAMTNGWYAFRLPPGKSSTASPFPETYGWAATLNKNGYMSGQCASWVCPSQADWMIGFGNTYAFSIAANLAYTRVGSFNP